MNTNETFERLYQTYYHRLMFHALRFVDDDDEARDIVSDVFVDLWEKLDSLDLEMGIGSYLYKAVSSRALNVLRHKKVAAVRIETLEAINERRLEFIDLTTPCDAAETGDVRKGIAEALSRLPEKCREVFVLSYVNGLRSKDIAEAMGISVRTVEAHIYKALRLLREQLRYLLMLIVFFYIE